MIQANELRIGNYVYDDFNEIHRVESVQSNRLIEYNRSGDPNVIISKLDGCDGFYVSDYVNPIPLTEEILLKCGFSCTEESGTSKGFSIGENIVTYDYLVYLTWLKRIDGKGLDPYPFYRNGRHIVKYLHQLQNLYYALTGEELEVKM